MGVKFTKMHGAGNDFIVIDESMKNVVPEKNKPAFVARVCDRHFGVGSDGVIFIQKSRKRGFDLKFRFFNPDGSLAEMCGNGIRCFAKYAYEQGIVRKKSIATETLAGKIMPELKVREGKVVEVKADMGTPRTKRKDIPVSGNPDANYVNQKTTIHGKEYTITAVGMGNPHAIVFVKDTGKVNVKEDGTRIRYHTRLFPKGTNVHFIQEVGKNKFKIRTYERGVEDETLACGTGICASAVAAVLNRKADPKKELLFHARGGGMRIRFDLNSKGEIIKVYLIGPAEEVFQGLIRVQEKWMP